MKSSHYQSIDYMDIRELLTELNKLQEERDEAIWFTLCKLTDEEAGRMKIKSLLRIILKDRYEFIYPEED